MKYKEHCEDYTLEIEGEANEIIEVLNHLYLYDSVTEEEIKQNDEDFLVKLTKNNPSMSAFTNTREDFSIAEMAAHMAKECMVNLNGMGNEKIIENGKEYVFITNTENEELKLHEKIADELGIKYILKKATDVNGKEVKNNTGFWVEKGTDLTKFWKKVGLF